MRARQVGAITLGRVCAAGVVSLPVECQKCPRKGRYKVTRLIDQHGAVISLPDLKNIIAADCPKQKSPSIYDRCGVFFPGPPPHI